MRLSLFMQHVDVDLVAGSLRDRHPESLDEEATLLALLPVKAAEEALTWAGGVLADRQRTRTPPQSSRPFQAFEHLQREVLSDGPRPQPDRREPVLSGRCCSGIV